MDAGDQPCASISSRIFGKVSIRHWGKLEFEKLFDDIWLVVWNMAFIFPNS
jgi:hypothetical protein